MKKMSFCFIFLSLFVSACSTTPIRRASQEKIDLITVKAEVLINQPIEKVWDIVGVNFDQNMIHAVKVKKSYYLKTTPQKIGTQRRSEMNDGSNLDVEITAWEPLQKVEWEILQAKIPFLKAGMSNYVLQKEGNKTRLIQNAGFKMKLFFMDWVAKGKFTDLFVKNLSGIKYQAETGRAVTPETIDNIVAQYKSDIKI